MLGRRLLTVLLCLTPVTAAAQSSSRSVGLVNAGRLINAAELRASPRVRLTHEPARYGTAELVSLIERSAASVTGAHPGSAPLVVGDLSRRRGGAFPPHRSHRAGRDADVGFFYLDANGRPYPTEDFITVRGSGRCALEGTPCRLDVTRTWRLIAAMLTDDAQVQYVVLARHIRDLLLDEAERQAAPSDVVTRFRLVTAPMAQSQEHRNHFHLRVYCAPDDRPRCREEGPFHPWYRFAPGLDPAYVARARERGLARFVAEREAEPAARQRRRVTRERRASAEAAAERAVREAEVRRERIRGRRRAVADAREAAQRAERAARRARLERRRLAQEQTRREREAFRALSPDERRARLRAEAERARVAEEAHRAEVRRVMAERAQARREAATRRRAELRARHRARERSREERAQARRQAYLAHLETRRQTTAERRDDRRERMR